MKKGLIFIIGLVVVGAIVFLFIRKDPSLSSLPIQPGQNKKSDTPIIPEKITPKNVGPTVNNLQSITNELKNISNSAAQLNETEL